MNIIMPSGIRYYLPIESVTGKAHKLEGLFRAVVAIDAKAEKITSQDKPQGSLGKIKRDKLGRFV